MKISKPVRWTIEQAAAEFDINPRTLTKRLRGHNSLAGEDGMYSTKQICGAVFTSLEFEQTRLARHNANLKAIEEAKLKGAVVTTDAVIRTIENKFFAIQRIIETSALANEEKDEIYKELKAKISASDFVGEEQLAEPEDVE